MPKPKRNKAMIIGVTGNIGCGKTTVALVFKKLGAEVIDADKLAHKAISFNGPSYKKIIGVFGEAVLGRDKNIDRRKLSRIVFEDRKLLLKLNRIIHPEVIKQIKKRIAGSKKEVVVLDVPLLIESGLHKIADKVIVVKTDLRHQISRVNNKLSLSESEISKRQSFQLPLKEKIRLADFIIDNNGTIDKTEQQVEKIVRSFVRFSRTRDNLLTPR